MPYLSEEITWESDDKIGVGQGISTVVIFKIQISGIL